MLNFSTKILKLPSTFALQWYFRQFVFRGDAVLHKAGAEPLRVRDVRRGLLLRQDLAAAAHVWPLRLLCAARAPGASDHPFQRMLCPRHAQSRRINVMSSVFIEMFFKDFCYTSGSGLEYCWCSKRDLCNGSIGRRSELKLPILLLTLLKLKDGWLW